MTILSIEQKTEIKIIKFRDKERRIKRTKEGSQEECRSFKKVQELGLERVLVS